MNRAHWNFGVLREVQNELASGKRDLARDGGYFCTGCANPTVLDGDAAGPTCGICGDCHVKWLPPVPKDAPHNEWRSKPVGIESRQRLVPVNEAHARFEAIKNSL